MSSYVELSKRSKREQRKEYERARSDWGDINPISRIERDRTKYDRKRQRDQERKDKQRERDMKYED